MTSSSRTFRKPKNAEEEKNFIEHAVPKSTRPVTKWSVKIFLEWENGRKNNSPAIEPWAFTTAGAPLTGAFIKPSESTLSDENLFIEIVFVQDLSRPTA